MKKLLLSIGVIASLSINAQVDTLNAHFTGTPTIYSSASGTVSGNNDYGDIAKMQLFDATYGVTGAGSISNVLLAVALKNDAGGSFKVKIWENTAGAPGAEIGSVTVPIASVDTAIASYTFGAGFFYNVNASFSLNIPANGSFWAGVELPTGNDTISLWSNTDADFADGATHTGEFWNDATFHTFGDPANWGLNISLAVFPVINIGGSAGIAEKELGATVFPNPANNTLNFKLDAKAVSFEVLTMDGKLVASSTVNATQGSVDISSLESGMYMYAITTENGAKATSTFVKK